MKTRILFVKIRLSAAERAELEACAHEAGLTLSEYVRRRSFGQPVHSIADAQTINELRRLGGLLKHTHNLTGGERSRETALALQAITEAIKRVGGGR